MDKEICHGFYKLGHRSVLFLQTQGNINSKYFYCKLWGGGSQEGTSIVTVTYAENKLFCVKQDEKWKLNLEVVFYSPYDVSVYGYHSHTEQHRQTKKLKNKNKQCQKKSDCWKSQKEVAILLAEVLDWVNFLYQLKNYQGKKNKSQI